MNLQLERITSGTPGITPVLGRYLFEACMVCLARQGHVCDNTSLAIQGDAEKSVKLIWDDVFDDQTNRAWQDQDEATEYGAICLAVLIVLDHTDYTVVERSVKGTGFDYWLGHETDPLFQRKARLEVSGIFQGIDRVDARFRTKIEQTRRSDGMGLPAFVCVVEFGTPLAKFGRKQ